jgi:hypothetical protein
MGSQFLSCPENLFQALPAILLDQQIRVEPASVAGADPRTIRYVAHRDTSRVGIVGTHDQDGSYFVWLSISWNPFKRSKNEVLLRVIVEALIKAGAKRDK